MAWFGKKKRSAEPQPETTTGEAETEARTDGGADTPSDAASAAAPADARNDRQTPPADEAEPAPDAEGSGGSGLFGRLRRGLSKTRAILTTDIEDLLPGRRRLDESLLDEIEEMLITSDIGVQTTMALMERLNRQMGRMCSAEELKEILKEEISGMMAVAPKETSPEAVPAPRVVMVIGVNGVGKTTTIGKLAHAWRGDGQSVIIAAADTFRAAAVEQVAIWAERAGADIVRHKENADPAAVAFDGVEAAVARKRDILIIDTAGRLHTKKNLMEELKKIKRAVQKKLPDAPHEVLLVLDATTGQNALSQARLFKDALGVTGLVLTKLDGTAKGGVVVGLCNELSLPLRYIGVGEGMDDLQKFDPQRYADALFT